MTAQTTGWLSRLEAVLLPRLEEIAARIAPNRPAVTVRVFSHAIGAATGFDGHVFGVECTLAGAQPNEPDLVALGLAFGHLRNAATVESADVCWGHPTAYCEHSIIDEALPLDDKSLRLVTDSLPALEAQLEAALHRGRPSVV